MATHSPTNTPLDTEAGVRQAYRDARGQAAPAQAITVLHLGGEHTAVAVGQGAEAATTLVLPLGAQKTARAFFRRSPPTPLEMENAIAAVEEEVMRVQALLPQNTDLWTTDPVVRDIALLAGLAPAPCMVLPLDAMEQTFERLAAVAEGRPVALEGLPDSTAFASAQLILREFMHHVRFSTIRVLG